MASRSSSRAIPAEQRVFSLILALVASPFGSTKRELLASVYGYAERFQPGETDRSLERQFERDKDQVRALGIPIETLTSPEEPENTQLIRYRIAKQHLQMPDDVRFSAQELSLLRLASLAWAEGSLSAESRRAAMKLAALGAGLDVQLLGLAPHLGIPEPSAPALQRGIDERRVACFDYQLPDRDTPLQRRVAPLRLHRADGRWHLLAWDMEREAGRVFLLARIVGEVSLLSETFDPALQDRVEGMIDELLALRDRQLAVVHVRAGSSAEARLTARARLDHAVPRVDDGFRQVTIPTLDFTVLAGELAGYGDDVKVQDPPALRRQTLQILQRMRAQHRAEGMPASANAAQDGDCR